MSAVPGWQPTIVAPLPTDSEAAAPAVPGPRRRGPAGGNGWVVGVVLLAAALAAWPLWPGLGVGQALVWLGCGLLAAGLVWRWQATRRRHARARRRQSERLRVAEAALQATRARLQQHDQAVARRAEAARQLRELHDSVGARLVSALALAQQIPVQPGGLMPEAAPALLTELRRQVEASLLELRLALVHLDEQPGRPLIHALADLREQVEPMLAESGIALDWTLGEGLDQVELGARTTMQLLRLAQEALSSVACHAEGARRARLSVDRLEGEAGPHLRLVIGDDGSPPKPVQGFAPTQPPLRSQLGPARWQRHAHALGGQLLEVEADRGWQVDLVLPLPSAR